MVSFFGIKNSRSELNWYFQYEMVWSVQLNTAKETRFHLLLTLINGESTPN